VKCNVTLVKMTYLNVLNVQKTDLVLTYVHVTQVIMKQLKKHAYFAMENVQNVKQHPFNVQNVQKEEQALQNVLLFHQVVNQLKLKIFLLDQLKHLNAMLSA